MSEKLYGTSLPSVLPSASVLITPALTHTPPPAASPTATLTPTEEALLGTWVEDFIYTTTYTFHNDYTFTFESNFEANPTGEGRWKLTSDGRVEIEGNFRTNYATLHGGTVLVFEAGEASSNPHIWLLKRKVDAQGEVLPVDSTSSALALPFFDAAQVEAIHITDGAWTPQTWLRSATFTITRDNAGFSGEAYFLAKPNGYDARQQWKPISDTVPIAIPEQEAMMFLKALAMSPIEEGEYKPYQAMTDYYPYWEIELRLGTEIITFYSTSQSNIPWGVDMPHGIGNKLRN